MTEKTPSDMLRSFKYTYICTLLRNLWMLFSDFLVISYYYRLSFAVAKRLSYARKTVKTQEHDGKHKRFVCESLWESLSLQPPNMYLALCFHAKEIASPFRSRSMPPTPRMPIFPGDPQVSRCHYPIETSKLDWFGPGGLGGLLQFSQVC